MKPRATHRSSPRGAASKSARVGLGDALFTGTQQKVLRILFGHPERSFFANEVIALARAGTGAVQRELAKLVASGLVTSTPIGRQRHFRANAAGPIFDELRGIVMKTFGLATPLADALAPLAPHIRVAAVFGSVAKGADSSMSDIDLLVVSDALTLEDLYRALDRVERTLLRKISPALVTVAEFDAKRNVPGSFLQKIMDGPLLVVSEAWMPRDEGARQSGANRKAQGRAVRAR